MDNDILNSTLLDYDPEELRERQLYVDDAFDKKRDNRDRTEEERSRAAFAELLYDAFNSKTANEFTSGARLIKWMFSDEPIDPDDENAAGLRAWRRFAFSLLRSDAKQTDPNNAIDVLYEKELKLLKRHWSKRRDLILPRAFLVNFFLLPSWIVGIPASYLKLKIQLQLADDDNLFSQFMWDPDASTALSEGSPDIDEATVAAVTAALTKRAAFMEEDEWSTPEKIFIPVPDRSEFTEIKPEFEIPGLEPFATVEWNVGPINAFEQSDGECGAVLVKPVRADNPVRYVGTATGVINGYSKKTDIVLEGIVVNDEKPLIVPSNEWHPGIVGCFVIPEDLGVFDPNNLELSFERGNETAYTAHIVDQDAYASDITLVVPDDYLDYGRYCGIEVKFRYDASNHRVLKRDIANDTLIIAYGNATAKMPVSTNVYDGMDPIASTILDELGHKPSEEGTSGAAAAAMPGKRPPASVPRTRMHDQAKGAAANAAGKAADKVIDKAADKAADMAINKGLDAVGAATGPAGTVATKAAKKVLEDPKAKAKLKGAIKKAAPRPSGIPKNPLSRGNKQPKSAAAEAAKHFGRLALVANPIALGIASIAIPLVLIGAMLALVIGLVAGGGSSGSSSQTPVLNESSAYVPNYTIQYTAMDGSGANTEDTTTTSSSASEPGRRIAAAAVALAGCWTKNNNAPGPASIYGATERTTHNARIAPPRTASYGDWSTYLDVYSKVSNGKNVPNHACCDCLPPLAVLWSGVDDGYLNGKYPTYDTEHNYLTSSPKWDYIGEWYKNPTGENVELQPGDILCMRTPDKSSNHWMIYVGHDTAAKRWGDNTVVDTVDEGYRHRWTNGKPLSCRTEEKWEVFRRNTTDYNISSSKYYDFMKDKKEEYLVK